MTEDIVRRGYMTLCRQISEAASRARLLESVLRKITSDKPWYVLRNHSMRGRARLEFYKDEKSAHDATLLQGFIPLAEMTNAYLKDGDPTKLILECADIVRVFKCASMAEAEDWLEALLKVAPEQIPGSPGITTKHRRVKTWGSTPNMSDDKIARFTVIVDAHPKLNFSGRCQLVVDEWDIKLKDLKSKQYIESWPLHLIRKYGTGPEHFTIEAGRRCSTGEGTFRFKTTGNDAAELYRVVHKNSELRAELGTTPPSSPQDLSTPSFGASARLKPPEPRKIKRNRSGSSPAGLYAAVDQTAVERPNTYEALQSQPVDRAGQVNPGGYMSLQPTRRNRNAKGSESQYMPLK